MEAPTVDLSGVILVLVLVLVLAFAIRISNSTSAGLLQIEDSFRTAQSGRNLIFHKVFYDFECSKLAPTGG